MAILVTGGTGMLGSAVVRRLQQRGDDVVILDLRYDEHYLKGRNLDLDAVTIEIADLADREALDGVLAKHDIGKIVHLAAAVSSLCNRDPTAGTFANCVGTAYLFEAAHRAGVRRIAMASSVATYGPGADFDGPVDLGPEDFEEGRHPFAPLSPVYGAGKAYQEALARHHNRFNGMEIAGVRAAFMASPGRPTRPPLGIVSGEMIDAVARGESVSVRASRSVVPYVYMEDVVTQLLTLLDARPEQLSRGPFFNSGATTVTVEEILAVVQELVPDADITLGGESEELNLGNGKEYSDALFVETFGVRRTFDVRRGVEAHIAEVRVWGT